MDPLEKAIIATLSYFDVFDYPLTAVEIWKWLYVSSADGVPVQAAVGDVVGALEEREKIRQRVDFKDGFYFLKGRGETVEKRMDRYRLAERKFHRALRVVSLLRRMPFVKMIGICNTLAYSNSRREGDIDLLIVTKRRRVWQVRFWVTGFLKLSNMRPRPGRTEDTICPSFFVDEDHLDLSGLALENDIYLPYWVSQVVPVYDEGIYRTFIASNAWIHRAIPNVLPYVPTARRRRKRVKLWKYFISAACAPLPEQLFKRYQLRVMPKRLRELANRDSRVVVQDYMLKFHDNDRRAYFYDQWKQRLARSV
ncbi:MAG: hypothetical protein WC505_00470 [Patescibacteria group bacterium]